MLVPVAAFLWWRFGLGWAALLVDAYYGFSAAMFGWGSGQYAEGHLPPPDLVFVPLLYLVGSLMGALGVGRGHHRP